MSWSKRITELRPYFEATGEKYGVPWQIIAGISAQESMFNTKPVGDGGHSMGMGHFNRRGAAAQYGFTPEYYRQLPESEQVDYIGRYLSDLRKQYGNTQWGGGGPKWVKAYNSAKAGIGDDNYLRNVQSRINDLGLGYDLFGGKSSPQQPTNTPAPASGLGPQVAQAQPRPGPIERVTGLEPGFLAKQLHEKGIGGGLFAGPSSRTPIQNQGYSASAGPIPADMRPTQTNQGDYRAPSAVDDGMDFGLGLALASAFSGGDRQTPVPNMPMDTNDYQSQFVRQSQAHSDRLSQLLQERWSKAMAPQMTPEEEMV